MESSCGCPQVAEAEWQHTRHVWQHKAFYRTSHGLFLHMPIGIAGAIRKGMDGIKAKGYHVESPCIMLDDETGPFSAHMLIGLQDVPDNDPNVEVWEQATLYSSWYHGPFRNMKHEVQELIRFVDQTEHHKPAKIYTWVTNCPKCWKEQGGPTTVLFASVN